MCAHNASGRDNGCQTVRTPYIYSDKHTSKHEAKYKFHHLTYLREANFAHQHIYHGFPLNTSYSCLLAKYHPSLNNTIFNGTCGVGYVITRIVIV